MKKVYKEHVYTDKKHLRLTKELEEKFVKMLRDKWTHKWSSGYPDEDYDIMLYLSADIRQVLYDGIKSFLEREMIERVGEGEALEFQYVGATGTEDLDAFDVDEHEWPGTHGEDW